jgi:hypothetical protein
VQLEKAELCGLCGTADWQWDEDPEAFVAAAVVCRGCARREAKSEAEGQGVKQHGSSVQLVPREHAVKVTAQASRPLSPRERARREGLT